MKEILLPVIYNLSVFGMCAFGVTHLKVFRNVLHTPAHTTKDSLLIALLFGALAALGNFLSIVDIQGALVNHRTAGVVLGGLIGGPWTGIGAGLIGAIPRYFLGGFTMPAAVISSIVCGFISGLINRRYGTRGITVKIAFFTGLLSEFILKSLVILIARPFDAALALETKIALPTIFATCALVSMFIYLVRHIFAEEEKVQAQSAEQAMRVIRQAGQVLTSGLTRQSAKQLAAIIYQEFQPAAVAITSPTQVLAYLGAGADHHPTGGPLITIASKRVRTLHKLLVARTREELGCPNPNCPLTGVIEAPLVVGEKFLGSIKLFKDKQTAILPYEIEVIEGIASFLSAQIVSYQIKYQQSLLHEAEYRLLKAQVNPHFLFNTLAAIHALVRQDSQAARSLIRNLSGLLRRTLSTEREMVPLSDELETVNLYFQIEHARFGDRLKLELVVAPPLLQQIIPVFTLQPLVENAIKHGLLPRPEGGTVVITANCNHHHCRISIADNGVGLTHKAHMETTDDENRLREGQGIGLENIKNRLHHIYGAQSGLIIDSQPEGGTCVTIVVPLSIKKEVSG